MNPNAFAKLSITQSAKDSSKYRIYLKYSDSQAGQYLGFLKQTSSRYWFLYLQEFQHPESAQILHILPAKTTFTDFQTAIASAINKLQSEIHLELAHSRTNNSSYWMLYFSVLDSNSSNEAQNATD